VIGGVTCAGWLFPEKTPGRARLLDYLNSYNTRFSVRPTRKPEEPGFLMIYAALIFQNSGLFLIDVSRDMGDAAGIHRVPDTRCHEFTACHTLDSGRPAAGWSCRAAR
jgi:hypothetical protein